MLNLFSSQNYLQFPLCKSFVGLYCCIFSPRFLWQRPHLLEVQVHVPWRVQILDRVAVLHKDLLPGKDVPVVSRKIIFFLKKIKFEACLVASAPRMSPNLGLYTDMNWQLALRKLWFSLWARLDLRKNTIFPYFYRREMIFSIFHLNLSRYHSS